MEKINSPYDFFFGYANAYPTYSSARRELATALAHGESESARLGLSFEWSGKTNGIFTRCTATLEGVALASICGLRSNAPDYMRVIEARLSLEAEEKIHGKNS